MSLTLLGWLFVVSSIAIVAFLVYPLRSRGARGGELDLETCKARLEDIGAQLKLGKLSEAEADAARLALLSRSAPPSWDFGQVLRGHGGTLSAAAAVFLLVAGIGAATSYVGGSPAATASADTIPDSQPSSGSDGDLERLDDYARSIGTEGHPSNAADGKLLPDVNTMIERLAARLETAPNDLEGWRTLGWSYFHTGNYEKAATAFAKAVELDPSSDELKRSYEEAKAKASGGGDSEMPSSLQPGTAGKAGEGANLEKTAKSEAIARPEQDAQIRSMVDGLAKRLESSPRDVEGWTRLMRSRVVLGEKDVAAEALRKALEVFKDDTAATNQITAAATELGLKAE